MGRGRIVKDRIGDVSIKLQFGSDEAWTRALRHVCVAVLSSPWREPKLTPSHDPPRRLLTLKILLNRASA